MAKDLLFEIGTEEIPARFMPGALGQFADLAKKALADKRIDFASLKTVGTPRRLALTVHGVAEEQADQTIKKKGPSIKLAYDSAGKPSKAAEGFARGAGVAATDLISEDGYVYAVIHDTGKQVAGLLPELLQGLASALAFPKNMRWGDGDLKFVRPIHWLVALFGAEVVPVEFAGIVSGRVSRGHRVLGSASVSIPTAADYETLMRDNFVIVDPTERRAIIRRQVEELAVAQGGTANIDAELLEEVLFLVEYPTALCGRFEEKFLDLPADAIITPMREHQRYFPVFSADGKLFPVFITVRNGGTEYIDNVRHGNERVLRARLADARFFYDEDRKVPLGERVGKLKTIVFQEGLGTMYDKAQRLKKMSVVIADQTGVTAGDLPLVERAAELAKADLMTGMVCEFTELQGVMGEEYARLSGESPIVSKAIFEHYLPRFAGDILPSTAAGRAVAIADKIDNIVTTFSRGLIPTGSQDPYALRRQALGVVNILIDGKISLSLSEIAESAMDLAGLVEEAKRQKLLDSFQEFFRLRLKNVLSDAGVRYDIIDALLATSTNDVYDAWLRAMAMASPEGTAALERAVEAFTRAANLAGKTECENVEESLFENAAEASLYQACEAAESRIAGAINDQEYLAALQVIADLAAPIDAFFASVMVMAEDVRVRDNRLALLRRISIFTRKIADFSKIVPQ
ncbi:MAG: glycine--tRNA ligase subunit beta [Veillonellaceae bacterium]|nr:glycine--tRNA ligase subunit beta [Veillonellaceae bacterium]